MKGKHLLVALVIVGILCGIIGYISFTFYASVTPPPPPPTPIPTPTPVVTPPPPEESPTPTEETPLPPPTKPPLAYSLNVTFPSMPVTVMRGASVGLPVDIKSFVDDEQIRIRLALESSPDPEVPLPGFITYEVEGYLTVNPHETVHTETIIKVSETAELGELHFCLCGELEKPLEGYSGMCECFSLVVEPDWHLMLRRVFLWENGVERFVAGPESDLCNYLLQTFHKVNLQGRCVFDEERIQKIKENDKVIVLSFRFTEDFTISQWIEPKERDHIKTDENGYRVLEQVRKALFILEDNLNEGLQGHILVDSQTEGWSCWAIQLESGELDKTWIDETNKLLSELQG